MSEIVLVNVGVDYHDESLRVCVLEEGGRELFNRSLPNDPGAVRDLVSSFGWPRVVVIEACCGAADFAAELIRQTEWNVQLAHPGYVNRMKQGPDKTDMGDAWLLADLGRVNYVPKVWLADETTRQLRRLVRYREGLKSERKNVKLRIRALLREERIPAPRANPWTKTWKQLARFCGVTPCNASSGKRQADSGLVKAGSRKLRAVIIQAAQRLPRHVEKWKTLKRRLTRTKPANVATAAVANRWLRWLYHQMVTTPALERIAERMAA